MQEYVPFFDAYPELRSTSRTHRENDPATAAPAKGAKPAKVLRPFPDTLATLAGLAGGGAPKQKSDFPPEWDDGVARLATMPPRHDWPSSRWPILVADAQCFLERWAGQAHGLGWQTWELFGCHSRKPWGAIHGMGLVLLLGGDELVAMTESETVMRSANGNHQRYYRKSRDPLHPSERTLIWELGRERAPA
jgi:hypothetical protein